MGKNYKERASYRYLHTDKPVSRSMRIRLHKMWNRANYDIGEFRANRVKVKDTIFLKARGWGQAVTSHQLLNQLIYADEL